MSIEFAYTFNGAEFAFGCGYDHNRRTVARVGMPIQHIGCGYGFRDFGNRVGAGFGFGFSTGDGTESSSHAYVGGYPFDLLIKDRP
jgi:hypothetical protein